MIIRVIGWFQSSLYKFTAFVQLSISILISKMKEEEEEEDQICSIK